MLPFLLSLVQEVDQEKIELIYREFHNDMIRFARSRLKKAGLPDYKNEAEDAVQNAFLKIVKYIDRINFNASSKEIKAYVFTILTNEIKKLISEHEWLVELDEDVEDLDEDRFFEQLDIKERYNELIAVIKNLDEKYSITLLYHYQMNMSVAEIAETMGISEKTVYTRLARGRSLVIKALEVKDNAK